MSEQPGEWLPCELSSQAHPLVGQHVACWVTPEHSLSFGHAIVLAVADRWLRLQPLGDMGQAAPIELPAPIWILAEKIAHLEEIPA